MTGAVIVLAALLAAANGGNDVPKGVATLAGAGVTKYRTAILWGTLTTFAGCVASIALAERLGKLFSKGIVDLQPTDEFTVAVLAGVATWVALATILRLPVSTTHAIVGALIGAGLVVDTDTIQWGSIRGRVVTPLLLSIGVAFGISTVLNAIGRRRFECICVQPASNLGFMGTGAVTVTAGPDPDCRVHGKSSNILRGLHWLTSGAASFARGLNDNPKIAAIAAFALLPAGWSTTSIALLVGIAMAVGSLAVGMRVARRLAEDVVKMNDSEGTRTSLVLSVLVGFGANRGWPMSTTQVATGAIAGASGGRLKRLNGKTLGTFALAWVATVPCAAIAAAVVLSVID